MTENQKSKTVENPAKITPLEKIESQRIQHEAEKKAWEEQQNEVLIKNIDLGDKVAELEDKVNKVTIENKALDKALWRERRQSTMTDVEKQQTEAQRIGNMSLDIIKQRCQQGKYGGRPCQECQISLGGVR